MALSSNWIISLSQHIYGGRTATNALFLVEFVFRLAVLIDFPLAYRYVLGHDAMKKMAASNVLISGLKGLGVEIGIEVDLCYWKAIVKVEYDSF